MVCCQRPRKLGAKYTGHDIAPDEHVQPNLDFDYEGKRDRWNGYDSATYRHVVDDYQKLEDAKRQLKAQKIEAALMDGAVDESLAEVQLCCCCNCYCSHTLFFCSSSLYFLLALWFDDTVGWVSERTALLQNLSDKMLALLYLWNKV